MSVSNPVPHNKLRPVPDSPAPPYFDKAANSWVLSRYADVAAAMRDTRFLPAGATSDSRKASYREQHQQVREATSQELTPARLAQWQHTLEVSARALLVRIREPQVDLLESYGVPFCRNAAVAVTGADPDDQHRLVALARMASAAAADPYDAAAKIRSKRAGAELRHSFPPGPSSLRGAGFVALSQTLLSLLANMWFALAEHPDAFSKLRRAGLHSSAIDELLRYAGVPNALYRVAGEDIPFGTVRMHSGQRIILNLGAAHRDPKMYPDPERLDLNRRGPSPLSLGLGDRSCVGAGLVRMSINVATMALAERFSSMRLVERVEWEGGEGFRTPRSLRVETASME